MVTFSQSLTVRLPFSICSALLNNRIFQKEIPVGVIWFYLLAAVSTCVMNSSSESVVMTQTVGGTTCVSSSSSGSGVGGEDESRSEGGNGSNGSQQQAPVPSSPSTRKSFFKKNVEDGMDRYVILLGTVGYRNRKSLCDSSL
jgi:hypothetical protein